MNERLAALSVDLDEIGCYTAIHGLEAPSEDAARAIYRQAVPRWGISLRPYKGRDGSFGPAPKEPRRPLRPPRKAKGKDKGKGKNSAKTKAKQGST